MLRIRLAILGTALAATLLAGPALKAQRSDEAAPAPLPSQITTARKVFIANAGGEFDTRLWSGGFTRTYNQFYTAIKSWGRYELVAAPADADLVLEISFADPIKAVSVSTAGGSSSNDPQFRLVLLDPKTHVSLWTLTTHVQQKMGLQKTRDRGFDESLTSLVDDLKKLTSQPTAAAAGPAN